MQVSFEVFKPINYKVGLGTSSHRSQLTSGSRPILFVWAADLLLIPPQNPKTSIDHRLSSEQGTRYGETARAPGSGEG